MLEKLKKQLAEIDAEIKSLSAIRRDTALKIASLEAKFEVGDVVTHYGRTMQISRVTSKYDRPAYYGKRVLKSGELGKQEFELYGAMTKV